MSRSTGSRRIARITGAGCGAGGTRADESAAGDDGGEPIFWRNGYSRDGRAIECFRSDCAARLARIEGLAGEGASPQSVECLVVVKFEACMDVTRWQRIQSLFHGAADLPKNEQSAYLNAECSGDDSLIADVTALLEEDARGASLLDRGVA